MTREHGDHFMTMAVGEHYTGTSERATFAVVARSKSLKTKHFLMISCGLSGGVRKIAPEKFEFDATMDRVSLDLGRTNMVWTGKGNHSPEVSQEANASWAQSDTDISRGAKTEGDVLGHKMPSGGWMNFSGLIQGVGGWAVTSDDASVIRRANGEIEAHLSFRVPR
jgi:hypothetical protein